MINGKLQFAASGADWQGDAMYRGLEDRLQLAPQLVRGQPLQRGAVRLVEVGGATSYYGFPLAAAELRAGRLLDRLYVLAVRLPHPEQKSAPLQLMFPRVEIGRQQIALRAFADFAAGHRQSGRCPAIVVRHAELDFSLNAHLMLS